MKDHTQPAIEANESLTEKQANTLRIIHLTHMKPMGPSAKLVPDLISRGFCTEGGKRSKLTERGYDALLAYIKLKKG